jgi:hypothetical protein
VRPNPSLNRTAFGYWLARTLGAHPRPRRRYFMTLNDYPDLASFEILCSDFRRLTEYVEPTDANLKTYSHRLYELLLRACTDFESVCKEELVVTGYTKSPAKMDINDYKTLERRLHLERFSVGVLSWRPAPVYLHPFASWSTAASPLGWYKAYNTVKHNRHSQFEEANLDQVRHSLAGLFAMLAGLDVIKKNQTGHQERDAPGGRREDVYPGHIFSLVWYA